MVKYILKYVLAICCSFENSIRFHAPLIKRSTQVPYLHHLQPFIPHQLSHVSPTFFSRSLLLQFYVYMYTYIHAYTHIYTYVHTHTYIRTYIWPYKYILSPFRVVHVCVFNRLLEAHPGRGSFLEKTDLPLPAISYYSSSSRVGLLTLPHPNWHMNWCLLCR